MNLLDIIFANSILYNIQKIEMFTLQYYFTKNKYKPESNNSFLSELLIKFTLFTFVNIR